MRVLDRCLRTVRCIVGQRVTGRYGNLFPCIRIRVSTCVKLRKIRLLICPAGSFGEHYGRSASDTVLEKLNLNFCRALSVIVITVIPDLRDLCGRSLYREVVGISNRCKSTSVIGIGIRIVRRNLFLPLVSDLSTILIDREIIDLVFPAVCIIQCNFSDLCRADVEVNNNRCRVSRAVACIDPCLLN